MPKIGTYSPDKLDLRNKNKLVRDLRAAIRAIQEIADGVDQNTGSMETIEAMDSIITLSKRALELRAPKTWRIKCR